MTFELTRQEAQALAKFLHLLRNRIAGDEWHAAGIEDALGRARTIAQAPDLACAAIRAAVIGSNRTPAVIGMDGPHWRGAAVEPHRPYDSGTTCGSCGFSEAECRRRWAGDHEFESVARAKARHKGDVTDVPRAVAGLRDVKATEPPPEHKPAATSTAGTERVAAVREALAARDGQPEEANA